MTGLVLVYSILNLTIGVFTVLSLVMMLVLGFISGSVATWIYPTPKALNKVQTVFLGVAGSFVGGYINHLVTGAPNHAAGLVFSVIGAVCLSFAWSWWNKQHPAN